jgi:cytochrome c
MKTTLALFLSVIGLLLCGAAAPGAELRGHGGPVRAIAVTADGQTAITGSFDEKVILWSVQTGEARQVLLFHDGQVEAVAALPQGRFASAGADGRIAVWETDRSTPVSVLQGHAARVAALAVSPDGSTLASASWDSGVRLWPLSGGKPHVLEGHHGNVNAVAFLADGTLASAGYDATVILWPPQGGTPLRIVMPTPLNTLIAISNNRVLVGGANGMLSELDGGGRIKAEVAVFSGPVTALAATMDDRYVAASSIKEGIVLLDAGNLQPIRTLGTAGVPVWSLAFLPDGKTLLSGGADHLVREWDVETGQPLGPKVAGRVDPLARYAGNPDAEVFRACVACHTLDPNEGNRAGPTLRGIFGRRIASVPGYPYSPAFRGLDIVWTAETMSKLFELGPSVYTPGTKMPEQTINNPKDRAALIRFLEAETSKD